MPAAIWALVAALALSPSRERGGAFISSSGIRYSNMVPLQESSAVPSPAAPQARPSRRQCFRGTCFSSMAVKLSIRASEASRS